MKKIIIITIIALSMHASYARPGFWQSNFTHGYTYYSLTNDQGREMMITCNDSSGDLVDHHVSLYLNGKELNLNEDGIKAPIQFLINTQWYDVANETLSRSGESLWLQLMKAISTANSFDIFWNGDHFGKFESKNTKEKVGDLACESMSGRGLDFNKDMNVEPLLLPSEQPQINNKIQTEALRVQYKIVDSGYNTSGTYIYLISLEDNITINDVIVNRGNCKLFRGENSRLYNSNLPAHFKKAYGNDPAFPVNLKYGQETYFVFNNCPNLLETLIQTNIGEYRYTF